jgi:signal transduction histidine kinase
LSRQREAVTQITARLFANVGHDLGAPVTALRGYIKMVLDGRAGPLSDAQREYLTIAMESADRLSSLAAHVSKIPDFIEKLDAEIFDIRGEWTETVNARRAALFEKAITVTERSPVDRLFVAGERKQLRRVFERVVDLSIQSGQPGCGIVAEFFRSGNQDITVRISLSPHGLPTGADLSVVNNIIFLHGGNVSLEAQSETGFRCVIQLPAAG